MKNNISFLRTRLKSLFPEATKSGIEKLLDLLYPCCDTDGADFTSILFSFVLKIKRNKDVNIYFNIIVI